MNRAHRAAAFLAACLLSAPALAKVDLVTAPAREKVELTIYNSADLTLVRDTRTLTMRKGQNRLQYSWAGTLIDPTSLELSPRAADADIRTVSVEYPPRVTGLGIWNLDSAVAGKVPFELTCFTSGISWRAYYLATLSPDESRLSLEGYVRVDNRSGEDYEGAQTRLVVGRINLLDQVAELARRPEPYGRPARPLEEAAVSADDAMEFRTLRAEAMPMAAAKAAVGRMRPKEIVKEGLSEYFLYSIEGTEDLPADWGKRLVSFTAADVPVENLYRYEEEVYGPKPVRFLAFANDAAHKLGKEPIPDGLYTVFGRAGDGGRLRFVGKQFSKYVPQGGEVNLQLGPSDEVSVTPTVMDLATDNYEWNKDDQITGWDERQTVKVEAANHRDIPVTVEIRRNFGGRAWELTTRGDAGTFEKIDADTVQYTLRLEPHMTKTFTYERVMRLGSRGM